MISPWRAGFKSDTNIITIVDKNGDVEPYPIMTKANVAKVIIDRITYHQIKASDTSFFKIWV